MDSPSRIATPAEAPGWRALTFRFGGVCGAGCGVPVSAGESGFWHPETKELRHAGCSPSAAIARPERVPWTGLPTPRDDWQRIVSYCRACVLREGLAEPPPYERFSDMWAVIPAGPESILAGTGETLPISEPVASVVASHLAGRTPGGNASPDEELAYGWPLVICRDAQGKVRAGPLVIARVKSPSTQSRDLTVDRTSIQLNVAVADPRFQPDADPGLLRVRAEEPLPLGNAGLLADCLGQLAVEAGLTVMEPPDPSALRTALPSSRPGVYNRAVLLRREPSRMTAQLLADLRSMFFATEPAWSRTAAAWLVRGSAPIRTQTVPVVSSNLLNRSQEAAVQRALASPVSVITGPPGTGKSQLVAALVATARDQDFKVLVASTNNGAVDEAVDRASSPHPATILRTGNAEYRKRLIVTLEEICAAATLTVSRNDAGPRPDDLAAADVGAAGIEPADRDRARNSHRVEAVRRDHAVARLEARGGELRRLDEAAAVAATAALALWNGAAPADLAENAAGVLDRAVPARSRWRRRGREKLLRELGLAALGDPADTLDRLIDWARATHELRRARERLDTGSGSGEWDEWEECNQAWMDAGRALVSDTARAALVGAADRVDGLLEAYRRDDGRHGRALMAFLDILPAWGTTALSVRSSFACDPAIFDLVVIDEASQCTLAAVLPLAFRARRIAIVGDPNQLPPVVTVPSEELEHLPGIAGLDSETLRDRGQLYGVDSSYTAFRAIAGNELLLDEHYRCHPRIAEYCDEQFYAGALHVLTDTSRDRSQPFRGLEWIQVDGEVEAGQLGGRINAAEVDAVETWIVNHEAALRAAGATLGVVTPFVSQANLLRRRLSRTLGRSTRSALDLRIGTAHTFQGAERDVMLFSPVIATGVPSGTIDWLEKNRYLVNVAVSRARVGLMVLGDGRHLRDLGASTLAGLHAHATSRRTTDRPPDDAEAALIAHMPGDLDLRRGERVGDHTAGLVIHEGPRTTVVVIEAGGADAAARLRGLRRDRNMIAAGAGVVRVPAWLCRHDPMAAAGLLTTGAAPGTGSGGDRPTPDRSANPV